MTSLAKTLTTLVLVLSFPLVASAHIIFTLRFTPSTLIVTRAGLYKIDVEVFPQFGNTGLKLSVDPASLPPNQSVKAFFIPPGAFFQSATQTKKLKLYVLVLPSASAGWVRQLDLDITQYYPPQGSDTHKIGGPVLQISPFFDPAPLEPGDEELR